METSLHRSLKEHYLTRGARIEAAVRGYRADVLRDDLIVEVQASSLAAIARKVAALIPHHRLLVVKPITRRKTLLRQSKRRGPWDQRRLSPKTGRLIDVFDELVHFTRVFPHPNLTIDVVLIDEEELRVPRRRRWFRQKDYRVFDRRLVRLVNRHRIHSLKELVSLLPPGFPDPFTTADLSARLDCAPWLARKVAYTLRHCGAAQVTGKLGNRLMYKWVPLPRNECDTMVAC